MLLLLERDALIALMCSATVRVLVLQLHDAKLCLARLVSLSDDGARACMDNRRNRIYCSVAKAK